MSCMVPRDVDWWRPPAETPRPPAGRRPDAAVVAGASPAGALQFRGLCAFMVVLLAAPQAHLPWLARLHLALLAAGCAAVAAVHDRLRRGRPLLPPGRELPLALALAGWALLMVPFSLWPGGSFAFLREVFFKSLVVFWLIAVAVDTRARLRRLHWVLTLLTVPMAASAVSQYLGGAGGRIEGYQAPLASNPNDLALMLNLLLPPGAALLLVERRAGPRVVLAAILLLDVTAIVSTFSRAGFLTLATLAALALAGALRRPRLRAPAAATAVLALACLPLLPEGYGARLATITDIERDDTGSAQERWSDTAAALRLVAAHPLIGAGAGQNVLALNAERGATWRQVHNVYLEYAADLGLAGLALFLAVLTGCLRAARDVARATRGAAEHTDLHAFAAGTRASLIAFAVAALFHPVGYHFYFYCLGGVALAVRGIWADELRKTTGDARTGAA